MCSLFLLLLAGTHIAIGRDEGIDPIHAGAHHTPVQLNSSSQVHANNNVTQIKVEVDNTNENEESLAKTIMQKVRDILAAAQIDDTIDDSHVTEKPKTHVEIFRELIDNIEEPLEAKHTDVVTPNNEDTEEDMGNIDFTQNQYDEYYYSDYDEYNDLFEENDEKKVYSDNEEDAVKIGYAEHDDKNYIEKHDDKKDHEEHDDKNDYKKHDDEKKYNVTNEHTNYENYDDKNEYIHYEEEDDKKKYKDNAEKQKDDSVIELKASTKVDPNLKVAFPELLKDLIHVNTVQTEQNEEKQNNVENLLNQVLPANVRIKKRARSQIKVEKSIENTVENNIELNIPLTLEAIIHNDENNESVLPDLFKVDVEEKLDENLLVHTTAGRVYGQEVIISEGVKVKEYLNIPYAKPPTGVLRFKAPQPAQKWASIRNTSIEHLRCWNSLASNSWEVLHTFLICKA